MSELGQRAPEMTTSLPGPEGLRWVESLARTECPSLTTRRARRAERSGASHDPIVWDRARGVNVVDVDGNVYVDLVGAFGVATVGHAHPTVVEAVQRQAARLPHAMGDVHPSRPKLELLEALAALAPFDESRIVLGLNGADALAAALKTAVLATHKPGVIAFEGGYHGLMYGPLSICGYGAAFRAPFAAQLNPHVAFAPFPRTERQLQATLERVDEVFADDVGAVVVEPALGRGGVVFPPEGLLPALAERCRARGALLIVDEIFAGLGRTGERWAHASSRAVPDLICAGKALGGGLPVSACIGRADAMAAWGDPEGAAIHTATFAGNPLACRAALAALAVVEAEGLIERARTVGATWRDELHQRVGALPGVVEVRGRGLMIGVELEDGDRTLALVQTLLERGWITLPAGASGEVLQLTPPLVVDPALLGLFSSTLAELLEV
ncbi:MAG TPA: aspartate aminotransferase family protein [Sandaracinaceae bacterium LLY-WYZ-13_1]|nr:aspartate aminotransferase family protein [Sandaracinaceae bacterium LLY-WYZ-13_1]